MSAPIVDEAVRCSFCGAMEGDPHRPECEAVRHDTALRVSFVIAAGDAWVDPDGIAWYVTAIVADRVYFERTVAADEDPKTVVRTWRKLGE